MLGADGLLARDNRLASSSCAASSFLVRMKLSDKLVTNLGMPGFEAVLGLEDVLGGCKSSGTSERGLFWLRERSRKRRSGERVRLELVPRSRRRRLLLLSPVACSPSSSAFSGEDLKVGAEGDLGVDPSRLTLLRPLASPWVSRSVLCWRLVALAAATFAAGRLAERVLTPCLSVESLRRLLEVVLAEPPTGIGSSLRLRVLDVCASTGATSL